MGEPPFRVIAALLLVTHIVEIASAYQYTLSLATIPSWIARVVIIIIAARMFFVRDLDNSIYQEIIMTWCFYLAAVDLFYAWAWLDIEGDWLRALAQAAAAAASILAAKAHIPSNILQDRRREKCAVCEKLDSQMHGWVGHTRSRILGFSYAACYVVATCPRGKFTAHLLLVTHGVAFFFGSTFYPGFRWMVYWVGAALSARLFVTKVEDVNIALGTLAIVMCTLLAAADLWIVVWCLTPEDDPDLPRKWVMVFPNSVAALASAYTTFTLVQDRKLLADILVTV